MAFIASPSWPYIGFNYFYCIKGYFLVIYSFYYGRFGGYSVLFF